MWKKLLAVFSASLLMCAANCHPCCRVWVDGRPLPGCYAPDALVRAEASAGAAAEELFGSKNSPAHADYTVCLSFTPPSRKAEEISDAMLCSCPGLTKTCGVYMKGIRLGSVESKAALDERMERFIMGQKPSWASGGRTLINPELRTEYTRSAPMNSLDDLVLLITGMAPVYYSDDSGTLSRA